MILYNTYIYIFPKDCCHQWPRWWSSTLPGGCTSRCGRDFWVIYWANELKCEWCENQIIKLIKLNLTTLYKYKHTYIHPSILTYIHPSITYMYIIHYMFLHPFSCNSKPTTLLKREWHRKTHSATRLTLILSLVRKSDHTLIRLSKVL
jgi:hypothetical protein